MTCASFLWIMIKLESKFQVKEFPTRSLAYVRNVGPYMGDTALFERLFHQVVDWLKPQGLLGPQSESMTIYHDDPETVPVDQQRISVGFTVPVGTEGEGDIKIMELPAGKYAVASFEILSTEYPQAWQETFQLIGQNGLIPNGLMFESYKNDPGTHPENKHLVDIVVAVQ